MCVCVREKNDREHKHFKKERAVTFMVIFLKAKVFVDATSICTRTEHTAPYQIHNGQDRKKDLSFSRLITPYISTSQINQFLIEIQR